jgi:hypothetical protein
MADINSNTSSQNTLLRIDTSRVNAYLGPEIPKLSFGQKFGRALGKFASWALPVAGSVMSVMFPGAGALAGSLCYGGAKVAGDMVQKSYMKENIAIQNSANEMANSPVTLPGLFEGEQQNMRNMQTFQAPQQFQPQINTTIMNREYSRMGAVNTF